PVRTRIYYDAHPKDDGVTRPQLRFAGIMLEAERDQLLDLSSDPAYQTAIILIYTAPAAYVPPPENAFLTTSDASWMFDTDRTPDDRFARLLERLLPFLRARLMAAAVKQKLAEAFRLDARAIDQLLTAQLPAITDSTKPALADFLDSAFAGSNSALTITRA